MARVVTVSSGVGGRPRKAPAGTSIDSRPGNRLFIASASSMARMPGAPLVASLMAPTTSTTSPGPTDRRQERPPHACHNRRPDFGERQEDSFYGCRRDIVIAQDRIEGLLVVSLQGSLRDADGLAGEA